MNAITKLIENSTPSISLDEFKHHIMASELDAERLLYKTRERILKEIAFLLENEQALFFSGQQVGSYPPFDKVVELVEELESLGFISEATEVLNQVRAQITELYNELGKWFNLTVGQFDFYRNAISEELLPTNKIKVEQKPIYIEHYHDKKGIVHVVWCYDEDKDKPDVFTNTAFRLSDLIHFAISEGLDQAILDSPSHTGEHIQSTLTVPQAELVTEHIIKQYLKSPCPKVTF